MKCYLLLRDNVETGPYGLAEISTRQLQPTDLIWVEGSSRSWRFPAEIPELAHLVQNRRPEVPAREKQAKEEETSATRSVFVALPPHQPQTPETHETEDAELEVKYQQPLEALKATYENHKRFRFAHQARRHQTMWMAALFCGLLAGAFMIKKMVDAAAEKETAISAAALPANAYPQEAPHQANGDYRNALETELVPVDTTAAVPKVAKKKVALKKLVTLTASEFKKGVFGGINDLELKVRNKSEHVLDKVSIEVAYLKPNGDVIKKENHTLKAVAPKSTKNLVIPPSKRGVNVRYRITGIQSHEAGADMREL